MILHLKILEFYVRDPGLQHAQFFPLSVCCWPSFLWPVTWQYICYIDYCIFSIGITIANSRIQTSLIKFICYVVMLMLKVQIWKTYYRTKTRGQTLIWCHTEASFSKLVVLVGNSERYTYDHIYLYLIHMDAAM